MDGGDGCTETEAVELEAMRKEDLSWHPCHVSLCTSGSGLIVDCGSNLSEDIITDKEEVLQRLRICSVPLQGDDCSHIQQGEHVLASQSSGSKSIFFDAEIEKAIRVRHSKRIQCRCTFMIKWICKDVKEGTTLTVPSSSIMKLATKSIYVHPTISTFLNKLKTLDCSTKSPSATSVEEDMDSDLELDDLLEKQIEEISNSTDVSKKKNNLGDMLLGFGEIRSIASKLSMPHSLVFPEENHSKRTTRSRKKKQMEMEVKDPPPPAPSVEEQFPECKSPLNPLAARAVFASLMSQSPQNLEYPIYHGKGNGFTYSSEIGTQKYVTMNNVCVVEKLSSELESETIPFVPKSGNIAKSLFSTVIVSRNPKLVDVSSEIPTKERESENRTFELTGEVERKINQSTKASKLTRSAVKQRPALSQDDVERKTSLEDMKPISGTNTRRVTRSAVQREKESQAIDDKNVVEESLSARYDEPESSDVERKTSLEDMKSIFGTNTRRVTRSVVQKEKESQAIDDKNVVEVSLSAKYDESESSDHNIKFRESIPLNDEKTVLSNKQRKSLRKNVERSKKHDIEGKTCNEEKNTLTNTGSLTCLAVHEETKCTSSEAEGKLEESKVVEHLDLKFCDGHDAEINLPPTEEKNNKRKFDAVVNTTQKSAGTVAENAGNGQGRKTRLTASKNQALRSSPRLRLLT